MSTKTNTTTATGKQPNQQAQPYTPLDITEYDIKLFSAGLWQRGWEKLGAHPATQQDEDGWRFCVWAPEVARVSVVGDFNGWNPATNLLTRIEKSDLWEGFVPGAAQGQLYKYVLETTEGNLLWRGDPYAVSAECPPGTASRLWSLEGYTWGDSEWLAKRKKRPIFESPLNIYEVHLGSWARHGHEPQGEPREDGTYPGPGDEFPAQRGEYYSYTDLAQELVAYVKKMGYTHIEMLPVMEHPFDGSWGYQPTSYYAPTSRYGTPDELMALIDACHQADIGVILDWVPGGFAADEHGLANYNGHMLYEREIHPNWGTHKFAYQRGEVRSFLVSNVLYWIELFHADGIRMDGVSSMLYLNFGVDNEADKKFNKYGTEEDLDASAFIRQVNNTIAKLWPDVMTMAEESTAWPLVTYPPEDGGLGFHFKWDMGWMNDTLHYMQTDFPWRPGNHTMLTFSLMYAFSENFILPLSHDEVVHGKCSLIGRMPGDIWRQFAGLRTLAFYQVTHPGAKLNFQGNEIAQFIEWRYYESIEWFLAEEHENHAKYQAFIAALNHFYTEQKALWQHAYTEEGFTWIDADNSEQSVISFVRHGIDTDDDVLVLINFNPASYNRYKIGVPREGIWEIIFNSDDSQYGGSAFADKTAFASKPTGRNGQENSVELVLPPLAGIALKRTGPSPYVKPEPELEADNEDETSTAETTKAEPVQPTAETPSARAASPVTAPTKA